jgi:hypothetical protein
MLAAASIWRRPSRICATQAASFAMALPTKHTLGVLESVPAPQ